MELSASKTFVLVTLICGAVVFAGRAQSVPLSSLAGRPTAGAVDALSDDAQFNSPSGIAVGADGTIFVADTQNSTIRKITADGNVTTFAGFAGVVGSADGIGTNAQFNAPQGVAVDSAGFVYVADTGNSTIRKIAPLGQVSTLAGVAGYPNVFDGIGTNAQFNHPQALAVDGAGQIFVADTWNYTIRKIAANGTVTTLAGRAGYSGSVDGATNRARFNGPTGIAAHTNGNLFVTEFWSHTVRQVTSAGVVTTIVGKPGIWGDSDGLNDVARFFQPTSIVSAGGGILFVLDSGNQTLRQIAITGTNWNVTTIAGLSGAAGNIDGSGSSARTYFASGLALDSNGLLYLADTGNNTIRISSLVPPRIHATGGAASLSWPISAPNYWVQTTSNVTDVTSWTTIAGPAAIVGDRFVITNNSVSTPAFYRLRAN
ncbi:MAG: repeat containing protein [Verrucomicrobiales bacterium]|nr:repeat containing protein [Verrucomicrobiales bacterium]